MAQISRWTELSTTTKPSEQMFAPLDTALSKRAVLRLRKVEDYVEKWPRLTLLKNIELGVDLTMELGLMYDTFGAGSEDTANWTVYDDGNTNLVLSSVVKDSDTKCTLTFAAEELWPQLELEGVSVTDVDPVFAVTLTRGAFTSEALCENSANWTISVGDTDLTVASITYIDATSCTIETTGTCAAGTFTAKVMAAALDGDLDSGVASYDTTEETSTCTNIDHKAGWIRFIAEAAGLAGSFDSGQISLEADITTPGSESYQTAPELLVLEAINPTDEDPVLKVLCNRFQFVVKHVCENLDMWNIDTGDTDLTVGHIEYVDRRTAHIHFIGTAAAGFINIFTEPGLMFNDEYTYVGTSYILGGAAWANGPYVPQEMAGDLHIYQSMIGEDVPSYFETATVVDDGEGSDSSVDLVYAAHVNPRQGFAFWYEPADTESANFKIYGKLLLDV